MPLAVAREAGRRTATWSTALVWPEAAVRRAAAAAARSGSRGPAAGVFAWRADGPQDPPILPDPHSLSRLKRHDYVVRVLRSSAAVLFEKANASRWVFRMGDTDGI